MDIIIAGVGGVGFRLANALSIAHNVIVMDRNSEALSRLQESVDVLTISGNVEDPKTYEALKERSFDLFIAVTDSDEINIISCLIAQEKINVQRKIVRLRNEFFARSTIAQKVGISDAVFPYELTALSLRSLLDFPKANNVKSFYKTSFKLVSVRVARENSNEQIPVFSLNSNYVSVVGIDRDKKFFIPSDDEMLLDKDMLYLFGAQDDIRQICSQVNQNMPRSIKNIVIFGADMLGIEIAKVLCRNNISIKIIEKDITKCNNAAQILQDKATVINSRYGDIRFYEEEGLKNADMIIASSSNDEENIVKCVEAKEQGIEKVVAINNDIVHYNLMHSLGMMVIRGPKINAYYSILEVIGSSSLVREKLFCGGEAIGFIREVLPETRFIYPIEGENILAFIIQNDALMLLNKKFMPIDTSMLVCFCKKEAAEKCRKWINAL
ncbi:MAG: NAD-binding protein [Sulfurospirillum sp.]|nr:NAD-binding protein [Sulfurospirillum sp.]